MLPCLSWSLTLQADREISESDEGSCQAWGQNNRGLSPSLGLWSWRAAFVCNAHMWLMGAVSDLWLICSVSGGHVVVEPCQKQPTLILQLQVPQRARGVRARSMLLVALIMFWGFFGQKVWVLFIRKPDSIGLFFSLCGLTPGGLFYSVLLSVSDRQ